MPWPLGRGLRQWQSRAYLPPGSPKVAARPGMHFAWVLPGRTVSVRHL